MTALAWLIPSALALGALGLRVWLRRSGTRSAETLRMMSTPPVLSSATWVATSGTARKDP